MIDNLFTERALRTLERRQRDGRERSGGDAINHKLQVDIVLREIHQIVHHKLRLELLLKILGICSPDSKAHYRPDVAEHRVANDRTCTIFKLRDILVCKRKVKPILPSLGEYAREGIGCEVLELIDIEVEIVTLILGRIDA